MMNKVQMEQFIAEATDHIANMERLLLAMETNPDNREIVAELFKHVHGLKGISGYAGLNCLNQLCHELENVLDRVRKGALISDAELVDVLLRGRDLLEACVVHVNDPRYGESAIADFIASLTSQFMITSTSTEETRRSPAETQDRFVTAFIEAARQHLESLSSAVQQAALGVDTGAGRSTIQRTLHAFRNSASYLGYTRIVTLLDGATKRFSPEHDPSADDLGFLKESVELLSVEIDSLAKTVSLPQGDDHPGPTPSQGAASPTSLQAEVLRVSMSALDKLLNAAAELVVSKNALVHIVSSPGNTAAEEPWLAELRQTAETMEKATDNLYKNMMSIRLVPISYLFERFPRIVRDASRQSNRMIHLRLLGESTRIDKAAADAVYEPIVHLLRNAIAHGIESSEVRVKAGKSETGTIAVEADQDGSTIIIDVSDDGQGIDSARVTGAAKAAGIIQGGLAGALSDEQAAELIFRPGFTTLTEAGHLAGRGVGLDVVTAALTKIGGQVEVTSDRGRGTRFRLRIPLSLSVIETVIVSAGSQEFAIPASYVVEVISVTRADCSETANLPGIMYGEQSMPLQELSDALRLNGTGNANLAPDTQMSVLVINTGRRRRFGLIVDRIIARQSILLKPLSPDLARIRYYSGATAMSDGRLILVLNPLELVS
jgi:two-component system, chemotaxis family, sensor kinase CheA